MAIEVAPLPLPASADPTKFTDFGREVKGINPGTLTPEQFKEIEQLLYKVRHDRTSSQVHSVDYMRANTAFGSTLPQRRPHARTAVCSDQGMFII